MTSRRVMAGIKTYLQGASITLSGLTYATTQETADEAFPRITIEETGTEEHEVLRGVYTITVDCHLETDPERSTDAQHSTTMDEFYTALGDTTALTSALEAEASLKCWDVRGVNQTTMPDQGRRKTTITLQVTAAQA